MEPWEISFASGLEVEAQADQTWVVVNDPVPAGSTILGKGPGKGLRAPDQRGRTGKAGLWPAFEERSFEAFRAYYEYVPKGKWTVEYTVRLNQSGRFQLADNEGGSTLFPGDVRRNSEPDD